MILQASLIGGWEKLELWDHTYMALFGLLILVCILEVILLKITTSAGLFTRPHHHYDSDYDDSGEYEEDIYYEDITSNYDQYARRQMRYRHQQQEQERQQYQYQNQQQQQYYYNYYDQNPQNNYFFNNYHTHSTDVFRFVY